MDFAIQVLFLIVGFCAALFVGGMLRWSRSKGVPKGLSMDGGAVRLDGVGKGRRSRSDSVVARPAADQSESATQETEDSAARPKPSRKARRKGK